MAAPAEQWKTFKFFSSETIRDTTLEALEMTASYGGVSSVATGDATGVIRIFDHSCKTALLEFEAYSSAVTHLKLLKADLVLVSIGDDDAANVAIIRIWDLKKLNPTTKRPLMTKEHRIFDAPKYPPPPASEFITLRINFNPIATSKLKFLGNRKGGGEQSAKAAEDPDAPAPIPAKDFKTCITSFDVSEDFLHTAIALVTNEIFFIRGNLERERSPKIKRLRSGCSKGKLGFVGFPRLRPQQDAVSGFTHTESRSTFFAALAFAVYDDAVTVWRCTAKGDYIEHSFEPMMGAANECAVLNDAELIVASPSSSQVAFFGGDQFMEEMSIQWDANNLRPRRFCEIDGEKRCIGVHKHYLFVLSCVDPDKHPEKFQLQLFDPEGRIKALSTQQSSFQNVACIISGTSEILVVSQDAKSDTVSHRVVRLAEVDTQNKLEQLFKKGLYEEAKRMCKRLQTDDIQQQMDIRRKYGDHLYDKGKFDQAIEQYVEAIGHLEPSYVIRRFLDTQRIGNLTRYLEELHHERHRIANKNHTTLLLNCYTKQKNEVKLNEFIRRTDIHIDVANAIRVCRDAGYYEAATYLAKTHNEPGEYVRIQMEHQQNHLDALNFIRTLPVNVAESILQQHGKELLSRIPVETTETLIQLCSEWRGPARVVDDAAKHDAADIARTRSAMSAPKDAAAQHPHRADAHNFIPIFVDSPLCLMQFLESVVRNSLSGPNTAAATTIGAIGETVVLNTLLELCLTKDLKRTIRSREGATSGTILTDALSSSIPMPTELGYPQRRERALNILHEYEGRYDKYHALILVQQAEFEDGILFMLKSMKLHREIFSYYAKKFEDVNLPQPDRESAKTKLIQLCDSVPHDGNEDQSRELWIDLLSILARCEYDVSADISQVLGRIEKGGLLPPIAVIDILCANSRLQLKTVRSYVLGLLQKDYKVIDENQERIKEWNDQTTRFKKEITELSTTASVFQSNKCTACSSLLDNPSIHFLCRHSFHHRCLHDERECNICSTENRRTLSLQKEYDDVLDQHEEFFNRVRSEPDGFGVVADYFGRSIFSNPALKRQRLVKAPMNASAVAAGSDDDDDDMDDFNRELDNPEDVEAW